MSVCERGSKGMVEGVAQKTDETDGRQNAPTSDAARLLPAPPVLLIVAFLVALLDGMRRAQGTQRSTRKPTSAADGARETQPVAVTGRPRPITATPTAVPIVTGPVSCAVEEGEAR